MRKVRGIRLPDSTPPAVGFGRLPSPERAKEKYPLRAALPRRAVTLPTARRWRLYRSQQMDQGATPQCVAYTGKHWEKSLPTYTTTGELPSELYRRCKGIDPWPGEDGTSADALLQVYRALGKVASWHWYDGGDKESAIRWLLTKGPMWWGAGWSESMFRTDTRGRIEVTGALIYGHETLWIGYDRALDMMEICNSWGNSRFGIEGRGWIKGADFWRVTDQTGDLVGVQEV
jgi:hypothetical protein